MYQKTRIQSLAIHLLCALGISFLLRHGALASPASADPPAPHEITSTLVILADTTDTPGMSSLLRVRALAQAASWYYSLNSYGREDLCPVFLDADGPQGDHDWHTIGPSLATYRGNEHAFVVDALGLALARAGLPEMVRLTRAIVVSPASQQMGARTLYACAFPHATGDYIETSKWGRRMRIYVQDIVLVSEEDDLGTWVHELGHTLPSKYPSSLGLRLTDRYSYDDPAHRYGHTGRWDVMGTGSRWGNPQGTSPVHMSSYTKEAANWLRYTRAAVGQEYTLVALEHQKAGDTVLTLDDPASDDPLCYYILEARDAEVFFGAPESGVMLYHVTYDPAAGHAVVEIVEPQQGEAMSTALGWPHERPTLRGGGQPDGATEYVCPAGGFRVTLVTEAFAPYRATVRIERP